MPYAKRLNASFSRNFVRDRALRESRAMAQTGSTTISGPNPPFVDSEIVLGLVAPVGTNFAKFQHLLTRCLKPFGYQSSEVRLSKLIDNFRPETPPPGSKLTAEAVRLHRLMHAGNVLRYESAKGEILALAAAKDIRSKRGQQPMLKTLHVIRSLKHPDEVRALRRIYGSGFYLIGISVEEAQRRRYLEDEQGCAEQEVDDLLRRDEHEEDQRYITDDGSNFGQRTRDTFQLADAVIPLEAERELKRFLDLLFGCPFHTPTPDEYAMFLAFGASLRSADLSRQVGAVVVSEGGDIVGVGANDVPRAGGGLYWPGSEDRRDHVRGHDSNEERRTRIIVEVLERLHPAETDLSAWVSFGQKALETAGVMDITEYGRAAHAEMEAILSCARSGTSTRRATLYSTTFPCHNCAKHIIAAGIRRVVYVEPYPKSQAKELFEDSIRLGRSESSGDRVLFEPFVGIGPRRFFDLFSMALSSGNIVKRKERGKKRAWVPETGILRIPMLPNSYLDREQLAENELMNLTRNAEES
ncbi:MAG: anti-phage dCTP deaminase [Myxococcota bacterium]